MASSSICETTGVKIQTRDICNSLRGPHKGGLEENRNILSLATLSERQHGQVVSALDSQSSGPWFEFYSGHLLEIIALGCPKFN